MNIIRKLATVAVLAATTNLTMAALQWGGSGTTLNWSDGNNWNNYPGGIYGSAPGLGDVVFFEDQLFATGYTNVAGAVNNIVDTPMSIGAINYTALSTPFTVNNHFYTTLIPAGSTLTAGSAGSGSPAALVVGDVPGALVWSSGSGSTTNYSTITGAGTLNITNSFISVGIRNRATLDLTGLNNFNANLSQILIGASSDNPNTTGPTGWLLLAKTNILTTAANLTAPGILLGQATNATGTGTILLGQTNSFNADGVVVGGRRSSASMMFALNNSNSVPRASFALRGSAGGNSGASVFSIGDESGSWNGYTSTYPGTSAAASGTADFSGGTVDILADTILVGRNSIAQQVLSGAGNGTLIVEHGTVNATNVFVAQRAGTNASTATGTLTLKGDSAMNVANNFYLGFRTNLLTSGGATATLNVNDSAVLNVGGNFITGYSNNSTTLETINIGSGRINVAGVITNFSGSLPPVLSIAGGTLQGGGGGLVLNTLNGFGTITNIPVTTVTNALSLGLGGTTTTGSQQIPGTLDVEGSLTLSNAYTVKFKLGSNLTPGSGYNDYLKVSNNLSVAANKIDLQFLGLPTVGAYDLINYGGAQSGSFTLAYANSTRNYTFALDQTVPNHVKLNVAGGPPASLTWKGGLTGVWDTTNTLAWNNNTEKFYTYDNVLFDDTGSKPIINLTGTVVQGGMTFNNNSTTYTLADGGNKISGYGGMTKNGSGTLVMYTTSSSSDWLGPVNINNGTISIQNASSGSGQLFGSTNKMITIVPGGTLDLYGNTVGSSSGLGWPITFSGSGFGGVGAIAHTKPSSGPSLYTPKAILANDATIGVTTAGLGLFVTGINPSSTLSLAGHTLTTSGSGYVLLDTLVATDSGSIQVNGPILGLKDVMLGGSGSVNVGSKTLVLGRVNGTAWSLPNYVVSKTINIGGGTIWAPAAGGVTIPVSSAVNLSGALSISNSQAINFSGVISGGYGVTKTSSAAVTFSGADTYSGNTIVTGGSLILGAAGSIANSPLLRIDAGCALDVTAQSGGYSVPSGQTVQVDGSASGNFNVPAGATLQGSGTYAGAVTVIGGKLIPGTLDIPRTLTVGSLALNNASMTYELGSTTVAGANVNDLVAISSAAPSFSGTTTIKIVPIGSLNTSSPYTIFTYAGATLASTITNNLVLTSDTHYIFTIVDPATTPGSIQVTATLSGPASGLTWLGGVTSAPTVWDINSTTNWFNGVSTTYFFNGDAVQFDDTAATNLVDLVGSLRPASISMNNNSTTYTFRGAGSLRAGSLTNNGFGGLVIANSANNTLTGAGLALNNSSITFNQPTNATFTGVLNSSGSGNLYKEGTNSLTLVGDSGGTFSSQIQVDNGTLLAGFTNAFGSYLVTVTNSATVDVNGQIINAPTVAVSGAGVGGLGAVNNSGITRTNALTKVTLNDDTTFGAANTWWVRGAGAFFAGYDHKLTKTGAADVLIGTGSDTGLGDMDIQAGRLIFGFAGTDLGDTTKSIMVRSNASLVFAYDVTAGAKPATVAAGGDIEALVDQSSYPSVGANNSYAGDVTFIGGGILRVANGAGLTLSGGIHGPAGLTNADRGTLTLSGSNDYSGNLTINLGGVNIANSNALPANSTVRMDCTGLPSSDTDYLTLQNDVQIPSSVTLNMVPHRTPSGSLPTTLSGSGTWNGPINVIADGQHPTANPAVNIQPGVTGPSASGHLILNGAFVQTGTINADITFSAYPGTVSLNQPLVWNGNVTLGNANVNLENDANAYTTNILTTEFNASGNVFNVGAAQNGFGSCYWYRSKIRIGTDNAYPAACALFISLAQPQTYDFRWLLDLNGHSQTISNFYGAPASVGTAIWIGNDNTNADATLIFNSAITNTWFVWLVDNLNTNIPNTHKTGLTVASGGLRLGNNVASGYAFNYAFTGPTNTTYTGPTLVTGGILQIDEPLAATTVTVSGSGTLAGNGLFTAPVVVNSGGTLSPGGGNNCVSAIGRMTNYSTLTLTAGSKSFFEINVGTKTNDNVYGLSSVTYGGTLVITNLSAAAITNGCVFPLFYATNYSGSFASITPLVPGAGLIWNPSTLATDGILRVMPVNTNSPSLAANKSGSSLTFSWPADHAGWRLQVQTNSASIGITNNWATVPNSTNVISVTVPIVPANPTVFYRLIYP